MTPKLSHSDRVVVDMVASRYETMQGMSVGLAHLPSETLRECITALHVGATPLNLEMLLALPRAEFIADIAAIYHHADLKAGVMRPGAPELRCAQPVAIGPEEVVRLQASMEVRNGYEAYERSDHWLSMMRAKARADLEDRVLRNELRVVSGPEVERITTEHTIVFAKGLPSEQRNIVYVIFTATVRYLNTGPVSPEGVHNG